MRTAILVLLAITSSACSKSGEWEPVVFGGGLPFIEATLDDQPTLCLVDTGAAMGAYIDPSLGFERAPTVDYADRSTSFGVVPAPDAAIFTTLSEYAGEDVGCLLGMLAMQPYAVTLDPLRERIRFSRPGRQATRVGDLQLGEPIEIPLEPGLMPRTHANFDGVDVVALVDTGAGTLHVEPWVLDDLEPRPETEPLDVHTPYGVMEGDLGSMPTTSLSGADVTDLPFVSYESEALAVLRDSGLETDAIIGMPYLENYVVTFDSEGQTLTLQPY